MALAIGGVIERVLYVVVVWVWVMVPFGPPFGPVYPSR